MLDLPRFAVVSHNDELGYWDSLAMEDLMTYEKANEAFKRLTGKGERCYLVAVTFIAGPGDAT